MNQETKVILLTSIILNILFLFGGVLLKKRGSLRYLIIKIPFIRHTKLQYIIDTKRRESYNSHYYQSRRSQFQLFPSSDHEIIFLGDSLTNECEWTELLGSLAIKNRGITGDTTDGVLGRLDETVKSKPEKVFLMVGINDLVNQGKSVSETCEIYEKILLRIREKTPETKVFIQSVLPVNNKRYGRWVNNGMVTELNSQLQELAKQLSMQYIDLLIPLSDSQNQLDAQYTLDGIHLNGPAYLIWKQGIEKYVVE